jgi:hypothetical protein
METTNINNTKGEESTSLLDFYTENGYRVFTEHYHKKRGFCCGNKCRHCCYDPKYEKYNTKLLN